MSDIRALVLEVQIVSGHSVHASVAYDWSESHAGDRAQRWPVIESVQPIDTVWDGCCFDEPEPVIVEGDELVHKLTRHETRRLTEILEERG